MAVLFEKEQRMRTRISTSHLFNYQCILTVLFLLCVLEITNASSNSCPVSKQTVQPVDSCPVTEEGWRERAAIKNCAVYADHCDVPDRLEYHCVINPFMNETLEVCAYPQNIVADPGCYDLVKKSVADSAESSTSTLTLVHNCWEYYFCLGIICWALLH